MNKILLASAVLTMTACQPIETTSEPYMPPVETETEVGNVGVSARGVGIKISDNVCYNFDGSVSLCL